VSAAASVSAYLCNGSGTAAGAAQAATSAYAAAVVSAVASCILVGDASVKVSALANARVKAEAWVSAHFDAITSAVDCEPCGEVTDFAYSWGYINKYVFLEAIATASVKVCHPLKEQPP
jgi:hypothetical protein